MSWWTGATKLPHCEPNAVDIVNNGLFAYETTSYKYYYAVDPSINAYVFRNTQYNRYEVISRTGGRKLMYRAAIRQDGTGTPSLSKYNFSSGTTSGWHSWAESVSGATATNPAIPLYATLADGYAAMTEVSNSYYKLNAGYAVAGFVTWNNLANERVTAPFLISTDPEYTRISKDGTTDAGALATGLMWQNTRFTLSLLTGQEGDLTGLLVNSTDVTGPYPGPINITTLFEALATVSNIQVSNIPDPYGGPTSSGGGGDGEDQEGDDVPFSVPPNLSAVGSGLLTLFTPSLAAIQQVAGWMWSTGFDTETAKKIFLNPIDSILGLHIVPCATVPDGNKEIRIAGVGSGYSSDYTTHQYMPVDCGSVTIPKKWGSYLDYAPYTKTQIFLPYIGFRDIDIDDIQGKTVSLMYLIDILSGACNAELRVPTDDGNNAVLYSWAGQCAAQIPITSGDLRGAISGAVSVAASVGAAVISGGATAAIGAGANVAYNMLSQKAHVQRSGSVSGAGGFIAGQQAYIVRSQPNIALPAEQNKFSGYPSFVTVTLGSIAGYNEVDSIHLENIPATDSELDEIETLLKGGVIL